MGEDSDDLFGGDKPFKVTDIIDEDEDLFGGSTKTATGKGLFDDDDEEEGDLFGTGDNKKKKRGREKKERRRS